MDVVEILCEAPVCVDLVVHHIENHGQHVVHALGVAHLRMEDGKGDENVRQPLQVLVVVASVRRWGERRGGGV